MDIVHVQKAQGALVDALNELYKADDDEDTEADRSLVPLVAAVEQVWDLLETYLHAHEPPKDTRAY